MYPKSTKQGNAIAAFPDVCTTIATGGPLPAPYPNAAAAAQKTGTKIASGSAQKLMPGGWRTSIGDEAGVMVGKVGGGKASVPQLKSSLALLHTQLSALPGADPARWHTLLDAYVMTTAQLYIALAAR